MHVHQLQSDVIEDIQITAKPLKLAYQIDTVEETHDTLKKSQSLNTSIKLCSIIFAHIEYLPACPRVLASISRREYPRLPNSKLDHCSLTSLTCLTVPSTGPQPREQISRTLGSSDHQKISISSHLSHSTQQEQHRPKPPLPEAPKNHAEQISTLQASGLKHMTWRWLVLFKNPGL